MPRKKKELVIAPKCDHCGQNSETFVVDINHLTFCRIQYVGQPPIRDCMTDYYKEKKNVQEKEKSKKSEKDQEEKKVLTDRTTALKKLDELKQFLNKKKQASFQKTPS